MHLMQQLLQCYLMLRCLFSRANLTALYKRLVDAYREDRVQKDPSPVTDKLWKKFYEKEFGIEMTNLVIERMRKKKVNFRWLQLYQAKLREVDEAENEAADRLKHSNKKVDARNCTRFLHFRTLNWFSY